MPIKSMATTAFHHWIPQSAPWLLERRLLKPNLRGFSEETSSRSAVVWISLSISLSTSTRKSVTCCTCDRLLSPLVRPDECGTSSRGSSRPDRVSVRKLCFGTGILIDFSANRSCSCIRLFTCFISPTCWQKAGPVNSCQHLTGKTAVNCATPLPCIRTAVQACSDYHPLKPSAPAAEHFCGCPASSASSPPHWAPRRQRT